MKSFYKSTEVHDTKDIHQCHHKCKKDNADLVYFNTDKKGNTYCQCLTKVGKHDNPDTVLEDISNKKHRVNKVAFWVTFSFFLLFMLVLLYFFIQIFFIKKN